MEDWIGANLRQRRKAMGLTLQALAERAGVSVAMLSEVERGRKNPTVRLAYQVARALSCSISDLVEAPPAPLIEVIRRADLPLLTDPQTGAQRVGRRTSLGSGDLECVEYRLPVGASTGVLAPNRPGTREEVLVLSGRLRVVLGGEAVDLQPGDTVAYGVQSTDYVNPDGGEGGEECRFLLLSDSSRASAPPVARGT